MEIILKKTNLSAETPSSFEDEKIKIKNAIKQLNRAIKEKEDSEKDILTPRDTLEKIIKEAREGIIIDEAIETWISVSKRKVKISTIYLQNHINTSTSGIFICDKRGWITHSNKAIREMLGFNEQELSQMDWISLFMGKKAIEEYKDGLLSWDLDRMWELDKRRLSTTENSIINKWNETIPVLQYSALLMDKNEKPFNIIFLNKDLREKKRLEEEIKILNNYLKNHLPGYETVKLNPDLKKILERDISETKDYLESIFENSLDAILTTNNSGHITKINSAFKTLTGYEEKDLINKHLEFIFPYFGEFVSVTGEKLHFGNESYKKVIKTIEVLFAEGKLSLWEHYLLQKNGKIIPFEANVAVLKDKDGNSIGTIISFRDLTERRKAELNLKQAYSELQEAKEYLENIISTAVDGIVITDPQGNISRVNESVKKITGYTNEELIGMNISHLSSHSDNQTYKKLWKYIVNRLFNCERVAGMESLWKSKDGELIPIELNAAFLKDKECVVTGGVIGVRDIRERRKIQEIEMKNDFIANVSHELRTPLTSIKGSVDNLLDGIVGKLNCAQKEYLTIINNESDRLVRLINDLLDLNKLEARSIKFLPKKFEYISLVTQVAFRLQELAHEKGLCLEVEWPKTEIYIHADRDKINQVLVNLINNAIKFTEQGDIKIIVENLNEALLLTRIIDTGTGIPKDEWNKVFDKFYQIGRSADKKNRGTGLGLAITKNLIEMHKGKIWLTSEEGRGSEFSFTLPIGGTVETKDSYC
jgi:PAS domain S-box-containing protein